jgi:hypothetical protein
LARVGIEELLTRPDEAFKQAAEYVLQKNADLYRRLAQCATSPSMKCRTSQVVSQSGGTPGILNLSALESALAQPRMTFGGVDLYPTIAE